MHLLGSLVLLGSMTSVAARAGGDWTLDRAKEVLASRDWVASDPAFQDWIEHAGSGFSPEELEARNESWVRGEELEALGFLVQAALPPAEDAVLMGVYLKHENPSVRHLAALHAVRCDYGSLMPDLYATLASWEPQELAQTLRNLPSTGLATTWLEAARITMTRVLGDPSTAALPDEEVSLRLFGATRILARSTQEQDRELIHLATLVSPRTPILWVARARGAPDTDLCDLALSIFQDASRPVHLRAAAALVAGQHEPTVYAEARGWITDCLAKLASAPGPEPAEPWVVSGLLAVLRELPDDQLDEIWAQLLLYPHNVAGEASLCILAKRDPRRLVETALAEPGLSSLDQIAVPLALAVHLDPSLGAYVSERYASQAFPRELESIAHFGEDVASAAPSVTLWE